MKIKDIRELNHKHQSAGTLMIIVIITVVGMGLQLLFNM